MDRTEQSVSGPVKRSLKSPKSRTGCQRCKDKRIKCDEAKPACQNCIGGGATCPGTGRTPLRWSKKHEVIAHPPQWKPSRAKPPKLNLTPSPSSPQSRNRTADQAATTMVARPETTPSDTSPNSWQTDLDATQGVADWLNLGLGEDACTGFHDLTSIMRDYGNDAMLRFPDLAGYESLVPFYPSWDPGPDVSACRSVDFDSVSPLSVDHISIDEVEELPSVSECDQNDVAQESGGVHSVALLQTFYRISPTAFPRLSDHDLIGHFFKHVCKLYSCFDSKLNPFRKLVAESLSLSSTINLAVQSMAMAHLANWYPYMAPLGVAKRSQAWRALQQDLHCHRIGQSQSKTTLLSLLLLGLSSSWHHCSNVGLQYLCVARNLIQRELQAAHNGQVTVALGDQEFYTGALVHWEMLASFIDPVSITPFAGHGQPSLVFPKRSKPALPHPWTGIATELHFALAEIGRVLLRQRHPGTAVESSPYYDQSLNDGDRHWARTLERFLRNMRIDEESEIADYEDSTTPKTDMVRTARAHQLVGLLEVYRIYPDLLLDRLNDTVDGKFQLSLPDDHSAYTRIIDSCSTAIAIQVMDLLEPISLASGTCRLHPLLLSAAACQLRFPDAASHNNERVTMIVHQRYNVEERMLALSRKFPQQPLLRMSDIIQEVWDRLDAGYQDPHWIDVINEKGWQTLMG